MNQVDYDSPNDICTAAHESNCEGCNISGKLKCRFSACVNFSCLLNRVPKEVVDEYLMKNEVMRKAWEKAGYKIGND